MLNREMTKEIVTVKGLAEYLHCHASTVYRLAKRGDIRGFRLGGGWRFKIGDIRQWCRSTTVNVASSRSGRDRNERARM
jgi:excisionase family DNA binding protein